MRLLRSIDVNVNAKGAYTFIYINDMAYYKEELEQKFNVVWIAANDSIYAELKRRTSKDIFLDYLFINGARPSNIIALGQDELDLLAYPSAPIGTVYYGEGSSLINDLKVFLEESKEIFEAASLNLKAGESLKELKLEFKSTDKEDKDERNAIKAKIKANEYEQLTAFQFKGRYTIPTTFANFFSLFNILYLKDDVLVVEKIQTGMAINYENRFADFFDKHEDVFSNGLIIESDLNDKFTRKNFEKEAEIKQPLTREFLALEATTLDFEEIMLPEWESDSQREVEKPALPLPNAHLVNALTSGMLQGSMYTNRGEALIKGSTIKVAKRIGDTVEEFFENRQMVFYEDEYTLSRENSSAFIEQNLRELSTMLKSIGQTVDPTNVEELLPLLQELSKGERPDLPGQVIKTIANYTLQLKYGFSIYNGEPGIGKTQVSFSVARLLSLTEYSQGMKVAFIADGAKHLKKMMKEAGLVIGTNAKVRVLRTLKHLDAAMAEIVDPGMTVVYVVSKDTAKRETPFRSITNLRKCPSCGVSTIKKDVEEKNKKYPGIKFEDAVSIRKNKSDVLCGKCGDKLVIPTNKTNTTGNFSWGVEKALSPFHKEKGFKPAESFGHYLRRKMKWHKLFDFLIVDEAHGMTADASSQTQMMRDFIKVSRKTMLMTGTLSNGYSSSLYFLLYAVMPKRMKEWGFDIANKGLVKWIDSYGARKKKSVNSNSAPQEKAIINPTMVMHHLAPFTVWGKIEDLNYPMPKYSESVIVADIESEILESMQQVHNEAMSIVDSLGEDEHPSTGAITKAMLYMSNNPFKPYSLKMKYKGEVIGQVDAAPIFTDETYVTHKERKMLNIVNENLAEDRKVMIYTYFNKTAYSYERIAKVLDQEMPNVSYAVMPDSLSSEKIAEWFVSSSLKHDVVIVPYKRVATGLDIPQYPEVIFYEEEYNIREIIQASRRPYRAVIQKRDVHINHLVQNGPQAIAMKLISEKIAASKIVEGEVYSEEGVESFAVDSIEIALKQRLANGIGNLEVPDFATTEIEEGRGRPWTKLEQTYIDLVAVNNASALSEIVPETTEDIHTAEAEEEDVLETEQEIVEESISISPEVAEEINIEIDTEPVVFGYVIERKSKRSKAVIEKGVLPVDITALKERLSSEEKVQLTFF